MRFFLCPEEPLFLIDTGRHPYKRTFLSSSTTPDDFKDNYKFEFSSHGMYLISERLRINPAVHSAGFNSKQQTGRFMIAVVQRVETCSVSVDGNMVSSIGKGLLILLGVHRDDTEDHLRLLARKCLGLRVFSDDRGKMNLSVKDVGGEILVVSQFTLFGDVRRGLRPYFGEAAPPDIADEYYGKFMGLLAEDGIGVKGGVFAAHMHVDLVNDGPVTIILDTSNM